MPALKSSQAFLLGNIYQYSKLKNHLQVTYVDSLNPFDLAVQCGYEHADATSEQLDAYVLAMSRLDEDSTNSVITGLAKQLCPDEEVHLAVVKEWDAAYSFLMTRTGFRANCHEWIKEAQLDAAGLARQTSPMTKLQTGIPLSIVVDDPSTAITAKIVIQNDTAIRAFHTYLFGPEGFDGLDRKPKPHPFRYTRALFRELFDNTKKTLTRSMKQLKLVCPEINRCWMELQDATLLKTHESVARFFRMVHRATRIAAYFGNDAHRHLEMMEEELRDIVTHKRREDYEAKGITFLDKRRANRLFATFSEEHIAALNEEIRQDLIASQCRETLQRNLVLSQALEETTVGTAGLETLTTDDILSFLGVTNGSLPGLSQVVPVQGWSSFISLVPTVADRRLLQGSAQSTWRSIRRQAKREDTVLPATFQIKEKHLTNLTFDADVKSMSWMPLNPRWVQLVGVLAVLRHFTRSDPNHLNAKPGFMINDDVGLGKTGLAAMVIAMLAHMIELRQADTPWPPFFGDSEPVRPRQQLLFGHTELKDEPFLIVAPPALLSQWYEELQMWLGGSFEIHPYERYEKSRKDWFKKNSITSSWARSGLPLHRKIILATTSAITDDGRVALQLLAERDCQSEAVPFNEKYATSNDLVLHHDFTMVVIDEIHNFRGGKQNYEAALVLRDHTNLMLGLSATPLYSGLRDLHILGRILNLPGLIGVEADLWEETALAEERTASRNQNRNRVPAEADSQSAQQAVDQSEECQRKHLERLKEKMDPYRLRRTRESNGEIGVTGSITGLKPLWEVDLDLPTEDWEVEMIAQARAEEEEKETKPKPKSHKPKLPTTRTKKKAPKRNWSESLQRSRSIFWLRDRQGAVSPQFALRQAQGDKTSHLFSDLEDFDQRSSTKMRVMVRIVTHHTKKKHWQANPLVLSEKRRDYVGYRKQKPREPVIPMKKPPRFVIYLEFVQLMKEVESAFTVHEIKVLVLKGGISDAQRLKVLREFEEYEKEVVLLISPVVQEGINLWMANVIIILTPTFTYQETLQIIGRVHQQPQRYQTIAYKLYSKNTADMTLKKLASRRQGLEEIFNPEETKVIQENLKAHDVQEEDPELFVDLEAIEDEEEDEPKAAEQLQWQEDDLGKDQTISETESVISNGDVVNPRDTTDLSLYDDDAEGLYLAQEDRPPSSGSEADSEYNPEPYQPTFSTPPSQNHSLPPALDIYQTPRQYTKPFQEATSDEDELQSVTLQRKKKAQPKVTWQEQQQALKTLKSERLARVARVVTPWRPNASQGDLKRKAINISPPQSVPPAKRVQTSGPRVSTSSWDKANQSSESTTQMSETPEDDDVFLSSGDHEPQERSHHSLKHKSVTTPWMTDSGSEDVKVDKYITDSTPMSHKTERHKMTRLRSLTPSSNSDEEPIIHTIASKSVGHKRP